METFWKTAIGLAGIASVGAFVFYGLYKDWLRLPALATLSRLQRFKLFRLFLLLTFGFAIATLILYAFTKFGEDKATTVIHPQTAIATANRSAAVNQSAVTYGSNSPVFQVTFNLPPYDVVTNAIEQNRISEDNILNTRTFWILKERGATITLGPCPGESCFRFELGEIETLEGALVQNILVSGDGFREVLQPPAEYFSGETNVEKLNKIIGDASPGRLAGKGANFTMRFGPDRVRMINQTGTNVLVGFGAGRGKYSIESLGLALQMNSFVEIYSRAGLVRLTVLDTRTESLKIRLDVGGPVPLVIGRSHPSGRNGD